MSYTRTIKNETNQTVTVNTVDNETKIKTSINSLDLNIQENIYIQLQVNLNDKLFNELVYKKGDKYFYKDSYKTVLKNLDYYYQKPFNLNLYLIGLVVVLCSIFAYLYFQGLVTILVFCLFIFIFIQSVMLLMSYKENLINSNLKYLTTANLILNEISSRNLFLNAMALESK